MTNLDRTSSASFVRHIGPGLLFAGAAVGISHLVQSTRAGTEYGLSLIVFVLLINLLKYPSFRFAIDYSSATGHSLVQGYRRIGRFVPYVYLVVFSLAAPVFISAVGVTTAAIFLGIVGSEVTPIYTSIAVLVLASAFLCVGNYRWLERTNKIFVVILTLSTLTATLVTIPRIDWNLVDLTGISAVRNFDTQLLFFLVALGGFMPNPLDVSVTQSIWTLDAQRNMKGPSPVEVRRAFNVGYIGSTILAICFLLMGAGLLYGSGISPSSSSAGFAQQLIDLFSNTLGPTLGVVAAVSALSVMLTTVLTAKDVYGRGLTAAFLSERAQVSEYERKVVYRIVIVGVLVAACLIQLFLYSNFRLFIDFATTTAFLTAPLIAVLNYICIRNAAADLDRPVSRFLVIVHLLGVASMIAMAALYFLAK